MISDKQLGESLIKQNYLEKTEVETAMAKSAELHTSLAENLISDGLISADFLYQAIADSYGVKYINLTKEPPGSLQVKKIPEEIAKRLHVVVSSYGNKDVTIVTDNPDQKEIFPELKKLFSTKKITIGYSPIEFIEATFIHYRKSLETRFSAIIASNQKVAPEIIDEIISDAVIFHASDIHFEPHEKNIEVRFRIDGVLHEAGHIPKEYYENIINRIKVEAQMRIDKHHNPQDGAMHYEKNNNKLDLRISIIPILEGEKIVMRLLGSYLRTYSLHEIGLSAKHEKLLTTTSKRPFGMILVVGPTGSGKTTTLYALVRTLNSPEVNITTIEDPIEFKMEGINQIQVDSDSALTFASGLRSIVRQDPDIILVGEIRDKETAEISVNAALTGHLLFSSFHANDAATALPRLLDMGVEPFLLSSTLELIIAQRLVRRLCEQCRTSLSLNPKEFNLRFPTIHHYFKNRSITIYESKGCEACHHTGFIGRVALFELIEMTQEMKTLILKQPSSKQIWDLAKEQGSKHLFEDGIEKVEIGLTSLDELLRVASPPSHN